MRDCSVPSRFSAEFGGEGDGLDCSFSGGSKWARSRVGDRRSRSVDALVGLAKLGVGDLLMLGLRS